MYIDAPASEIMKRALPFTEDDVHDYVDGRMEETRRREFEAFLEENPDITRVVEEYQRQNLMLRVLFGPQAMERKRQNNGDDS